MYIDSCLCNIFNFLSNSNSLSQSASSWTALVRPSLEYASVVWDPYHNNKINQLEKVQRRAARWVLNNFSRHSSINSNVATSPIANSSIASKSVQIINPF